MLEIYDPETERRSQEPQGDSLIMVYKSQFYGKLPFKLSRK